MIRSFAVGVCAGAALTWWLKDSIAAQVDARTSAARAKVARRLHAAADAVEAGLGGAPSRRAKPIVVPGGAGPVAPSVRPS
jgi:hypothetical protein